MQDLQSGSSIMLNEVLALTKLRINDRKCAICNAGTRTSLHVASVIAMELDESFKSVSFI
ncbi:MAG: hypothetical protein HXK77_02070 [Lachnospiraceae bacterium]|nr:hypothetical protein [Lachnospiraceae bacterium]